MATPIPERELEFSSMSGRVTQLGVTVTVQIYRFANEPNGPWQLEVVDHGGGSTVWSETFATEDEAYIAFSEAVAEDGIGSFAEAQSDTMH